MSFKIDTLGCDTEPLRLLLGERLKIIVDVSLRERDPSAHLAALQNVSEAIDAFFEENKTRLDPRLKHFLANASYQKALDWIS